MSRLGRAVVLLVLLVAAAGCRRETASRASDPLAEARTLVEQRQFDAALARLEAGTDPESLYLLGRAWAGKAESAPLPTPVPAAVPGGPPQAAPELKPEEQRAVEFYERALAARSNYAAAHLAIAALLAPHALARSAVATRPGRATPMPPPTGTDTSVDRVLRSYGEAIQADPADTAAVEALIRFALSAGRLSEADGAFQELIRRRREDPDCLVRYGDFLAGPRRDPEAAMAQYAQALIWRPADVTTRLKIADIRLSAAADYMSRREYASAEAQLREARKSVVDPSSPQAARLRDLAAQLAEIRGR